MNNFYNLPWKLVRDERDNRVLVDCAGFQICSFGEHSAQLPYKDGENAIFIMEAVEYYTTHLIDSGEVELD